MSLQNRGSLTCPDKWELLQRPTLVPRLVGNPHRPLLCIDNSDLLRGYHVV